MTTLCSGVPSKSSTQVNDLKCRHLLSAKILMTSF